MRAFSSRDNPAPDNWLAEGQEKEAAGGHARDAPQGADPALTVGCPTRPPVGPCVAIKGFTGIICAAMARVSQRQPQTELISPSAQSPARVIATPGAGLRARLKTWRR